MFLLFCVTRAQGRLGPCGKSRNYWSEITSARQNAIRGPARSGSRMRIFQGFTRSCGSWTS